jgi:hypothetical protein
VTALGRELLGFIWAIGVGSRERKQKRRRLTPDSKEAYCAF